MNLMRGAVLTKSQKCIDLGISFVNTSGEIGSVFIPTNRIRRPTGGFNWLPTGHIIGEVTADKVSRTRSEQNYSAKTDFETRREIQDFGRQNNSMSQPLLESTPLGTKTNNGTMSLIESILVGEEAPELMPMTPPTDLPTLPTDFTE